MFGQASLPCWAATLEQEPGVRIELLSPLLRWRYGPDIATFSLWDGVKWFFLAICFAFSEQIKKHLITPTLNRLLTSIRFGRPVAGDTGQSKGYKEMSDDDP